MNETGLEMDTRTIRGLVCCTLLLPVLAAGCGQSQGALLYVLGFGRGGMVEAQFRLTEEPILILIDDPSGHVDWPPAKGYLFDELAQGLLRNKAAAKIIPPETIAHLRQSVPKFETRGGREVGELAGATQVLWLEVQSFEAEELIKEAVEAAHFSVTVKVLDARAKTRSRVRLWPTSPQGHRATITLAGSEVAMAKTKDGISKELAERMAKKIAKIFYDHQLGDFGREEE